MNKNTIKQVEQLLIELDIDCDPSLDYLSKYFSAFNKISEEGSSVVIKTDGARAAKEKFTVVISGGELGDDIFFRNDGESLQELMSDAIVFYNDEVWEFDI
ncbi:MAG: hypothetical protein AAGA18_15695 [Verrucomicrobiota bacterium]